MSESNPFNRPNEDTIIKNPSFVCDECGFANVELVDSDPLPAAQCTNCGAKYIRTNN